jgi:hypothetical protein
MHSQSPPTRLAVSASIPRRPVDHVASSITWPRDRLGGGVHVIDRGAPPPPAHWLARPGPLPSPLGLSASSNSSRWQRPAGAPWLLLPPIRPIRNPTRTSQPGPRLTSPRCGAGRGRSAAAGGDLRRRAGAAPTATAAYPRKPLAGLFVSFPDPLPFAGLPTTSSPSLRPAAGTGF